MYMGPKGLGLGLNIAQSLANILGHKIDLKSQAGHGCLFSVNAPMTLPHCGQRASTASRQHEFAWRWCFVYR